MTKQAQIEAKKLKPIEIGDRVVVNIPYTYSETITEGKGKNKTTSTIEKSAIFTQEGVLKDILVEDGLCIIQYYGHPRIPHEVQICTTYTNSHKEDTVVQICTS